MFHPTQSVLDLGCGTGEDAIALQSRGVRVHAIDASQEMVRIARSRGVNAEHKTIDEIGTSEGTYDGVISNFGALNCVENLTALRAALARLVRVGGHLAFTLMSRFCLFETFHYLHERQVAKAMRRWSGRARAKSLDLDVFYPTCPTLKNVLAPEFHLIRRIGIGLFVPPSYVEGISAPSLDRRSRIDNAVSHWPILRSMADHQLFIFQRQ
jgi:SAM-dependent methyltransferase